MRGLFHMALDFQEDLDAFFDTPGFHGASSFWAM